ncbi:MAG: HEPN domain-containing protein [Bacteroidota bacterium]
MTKKNYIHYWKTTADKDWKAMHSLFKSKHYVHALFWAHLVLEKLCKAHWVKDHESNHPPKIRNLIYLMDNIELSADAAQRAFLEKMNAFQLEGRYPDYQNTLYKLCDKKFTQETLKQVNAIQLWLLKSL